MFRRRSQQGFLTLVYVVETKKEKQEWLQDFFFFLDEELVRRMKILSTEMGKAADGANLGEESGWFGTLILYLIDVQIIHPKVLSVIT